jgi:hypothetical protein
MNRRYAHFVFEPIIIGPLLGRRFANHIQPGHVKLLVVSPHLKKDSGQPVRDRYDRLFIPLLGHVSSPVRIERVSRPGRLATPGLEGFKSNRLGGQPAFMNSLVRLLAERKFFDFAKSSFAGEQLLRLGVPNFLENIVSPCGHGSDQSELSPFMLHPNSETICKAQSHRRGFSVLEIHCTILR